MEKVVRVFCFLFTFWLCLAFSSDFLKPKNNTVESGMEKTELYGFLSEPNHTIDLAVIGDSSAGNGFSPMKLWGDYGITSYVCAEGWQTLPQGYRVFKKMLDTQKPKIVLLETDEFFQPTGIARTALYVSDLASKTVLPLYDYHNRWKDVQAKEMMRRPHYTYHSAVKGQWRDQNVKPYNGKEYMIESREESPLSITVRGCFALFDEICRRSHVQLVLFTVPNTGWNYSKHNAMVSCAGKICVPYLDLNLERKKLGFDWKTDTRDGGTHLNDQGANKVTGYIGYYLKENYVLEDHRQDHSFDHWKEDYQKFTK